MEFKIFNYIIGITITKVTNPLLNHVADLLLDNRRLAAMKEIKDNYDISLLDTRNIIDKICKYRSNNKLFFYIKKKHKIVLFLQKHLEKHKR